MHNKAFMLLIGQIFGQEAPTLQSLYNHPKIQENAQLLYMVDLASKYESNAIFEVSFLVCLLNAYLFSTIWMLPAFIPLIFGVYIHILIM